MELLNDFLEEWYGDSPAVVARTSGSTGTPKEIHLLKSDMEASARATNSFFGIGPDSVLGLPLSVGYIAGKMMVVRSIVAGCRLRQFAVSNALCVDSPVDLLSVVPSQVPSLLTDRASAVNIANLLVGGAPLSPELERQIAVSGIQAYIGYGMTETCSHVALRRIGSTEAAYLAMPGIRFSTDGRGCLVIYSDRFSWRTLTTNDVVDLTGPESFVWRGRADNVINSGGIKLHPEEIERRIGPFIERPFYVVGHPSAKWGECVALVFEGSEAESGRIADEIAALDLPRGWRPAVIAAVPALPRSATGKLRRLPLTDLPGVSRTC